MLAGVFKRLHLLFPTPGSRIFAILAVLSGAGAGFSFGEGMYVTAAAFVILTANLCFGTLLQSRAFKLGWFHGRMVGRMDMRSSLLEAQQRGMSFSDWFVAECERDGIPVMMVEGDDAPE